MTALSEINGIALTDETGLGAITLPGFMSEIAATYGAQEALRWRDLAGQQKSWTYAEMYEECLKVAKALLAVGVGTRFSCWCFSQQSDRNGYSGVSAPPWPAQ